MLIASTTAGAGQVTFIIECYRMVVRFRHNFRDNDLQMKNPPHPGLSIRHDCLEPLGVSVTEAAKKLGVSRKQLFDVVNGHSGISPQMAIRLDKAFGGGANTWYRLQAAYDLAQAMKQADKSKSSGYRR